MTLERREARSCFRMYAPETAIRFPLSPKTKTFGYREKPLHRWFSERLSRHEEKFNKIIVLTGVGSDFDDFEIIAGVVGTDIGGNTIADAETV
jgi:hypothetical protein